MTNYVPMGPGDRGPTASKPSLPSQQPQQASALKAVDVSYIVQLLEEISSKVDSLAERMNELDKSGSTPEVPAYSSQPYVEPKPKKEGKDHD